MKKPILIDTWSTVGLFARWCTTSEASHKKLRGGKIVETHRLKDIEKFVYNKRPSLKGRDIRIEFSNQKV